MKQFCKIHFAFLLIATVLLSGCARHTQTEQIIDAHIDHINQVVDYAVNNFDQTAEVLQLENELSNCGMALEDVKKSHKLEIARCESEIKYWRTSSIFLFVLIMLYVAFKVRK